MQHRLGLLVLAFLASGCAANTYCLDEQNYRTAESVPPLVGTGPLKLPESQTALRIPPPPANPVPFGEKYKNAEGDEKVRCLDTPPAMADLGAPEPEAAKETKPKTKRKAQKGVKPKPPVAPAPSL